GESAADPDHPAISLISRSDKTDVSHNRHRKDQNICAALDAQIAEFDRTGSPQTHPAGHDKNECGSSGSRTRSRNKNRTIPSGAAHLPPATPNRYAPATPDTPAPLLPSTGVAPAAEPETDTTAPPATNSPPPG